MGQWGRQPVQYMYQAQIHRGRGGTGIRPIPKMGENIFSPIYILLWNQKLSLRSADITYFNTPPLTGHSRSAPSYWRRREKNGQEPGENEVGCGREGKRLRLQFLSPHVSFLCFYVGTSGYIIHDVFRKKRGYAWCECACNKNAYSLHVKKNPNLSRTGIIPVSILMSHVLYYGSVTLAVTLSVNTNGYDSGPLATMEQNFLVID